MKRSASGLFLLIATSGGCYLPIDRYLCETDADCLVLPGGRCEAGECVSALRPATGSSGAVVTSSSDMPSSSASGATGSSSSAQASSATASSSGGATSSASSTSNGSSTSLVGASSSGGVTSSTSVSASSTSSSGGPLLLPDLALEVAPGAFVESPLVPTGGTPPYAFTVFQEGDQGATTFPAQNTLRYDARTNTRGEDVVLITATDAASRSSNPARVTVRITGSFSPDKTWVGDNGDEWGIGANWSGGSIPSQNAVVLIPAAAARMPILSGSSQVAEILVEAGATLSIEQGGNLIVAGVGVYAYGPIGGPGSVTVGDGTAILGSIERVSVTGAAYLAGPTAVTSIGIEASDGSGGLDVGASTLNVSGAMTVTNGGQLDMRKTTGVVDIRGDAILRTTSSSELTDGEIRLHAGLDVGSGFLPTGQHRLLFGGPGNHVLNGPGRLNNVFLVDGGDVLQMLPIEVGELTLRGTGNWIASSVRLTVHGTLRTDAGAMLSVTDLVTTHVSGLSNVAPSSFDCPKVTYAGAGARINGALDHIDVNIDADPVYSPLGSDTSDINGDLAVLPGARLVMEGVLWVAGDFETTMSGALVQNDPDGDLVVEGMVNFDGDSGEAGTWMTEGYMFAKGNVTASYHGIRASAAHTFVFRKTPTDIDSSPQRVAVTGGLLGENYFANVNVGPNEPDAGVGTTLEYLDDLVIKGALDVRVRSTLRVNGSHVLDVGGPLVSDSTATIDVGEVWLRAEEGTSRVAGAFSAARVIFSGANAVVAGLDGGYTSVTILAQDATLSGDTEIHGTLDIVDGGTLSPGSHALVVDGQCTVTGTGAVLSASAGVLLRCGALLTANSGTVRMAQDTETIEVEGNATLGGIGGLLDFSAGTLKVAGNFTVDGNGAFRAANTHVVILDGTAQDVVMSKVNNHFGDLQIAAGSNTLLKASQQVVVNDTLTVNGTLRMETSATLVAARIVVGAGGLLDGFGGTIPAPANGCTSSGGTVQNVSFQCP